MFDSDLLHNSVNNTNHRIWSFHFWFGPLSFVVLNQIQVWFFFFFFAMLPLSGQLYCNSCDFYIIHSPKLSVLPWGSHGEVLTDTLVVKSSHLCHNPITPGSDSASGSHCTSPHKWNCKCFSSLHVYFCMTAWCIVWCVFVFCACGSVQDDNKFTLQSDIGHI